MFSRPRREVVEIPASCLPWISLQGEFLFPGVTSAFLSTQLITLSPSCYRYPLCSRPVPGKGQSRESVCIRLRDHPQSLGRGRTSPPPSPRLSSGCLRSLAQALLGLARACSQDECRQVRICGLESLSGRRLKKKRCSNTIRFRIWVTVSTG